MADEVAWLLPYHLATEPLFITSDRRQTPVDDEDGLPRRGL